MIILNLLLISYVLSVETNVIRDYKFTELKLSNQWGAWYHWKVAKQIAIDLEDYWLLKQQHEFCKTNIFISTNIVRLDNNIFEAYKKEIKKSKIKGFSIGAAITAGSYLIIKGIFLIVTR